MDNFNDFEKIIPVRAFRSTTPNAPIKNQHHGRFSTEATSRAAIISILISVCLPSIRASMQCLIRQAAKACKITETMQPNVINERCTPNCRNNTRSRLGFSLRNFYSSHLASSASTSTCVENFSYMWNRSSLSSYLRFLTRQSAFHGNIRKKNEQKFARRYENYINNYNDFKKFFK